MLLSQGEMIDNHLRIIQIGQKYLELLPLNCDDADILKLHVFYVNIEDFQKNRGVK